MADIEHSTLTADNLHASFPHGNIADIPAAPTNLNNPFYFADDEGKLYYYNGSTWIEFAMDIDMSNASDTAFSTILNRACPQATSSTAAATAAKVVSLSGFTLFTGSRIKVKFDNANTVAGALTLNVNSTGAKSIYNEAGIAVSATCPAYFPAGATVEFWYDGTYWVYINRIIDEYVNGTSGYEILANGKIKQWGIKTLAGGGWETITLLKTMKNTDYKILTTNRSNYTSASSSSHDYVMEKGGVVNYATESTTTFQLWGQSAGFKTSWQVEGY